jgi:hypothetical protein
MKPVQLKLDLRNGYSVDHNGVQRWHKNNMMHNIYGPAAIFPDGRVAYYIEGQRLTRKAFAQHLLKMNKKKKK